MQRYDLVKDTKGYAVVEATILFPIIIMIFAGLVLLATYLPIRMVLQQATQYAATALATEQSDTWLEFDETQMQYQWLRKSELQNVYAAVLSSLGSGDTASKAETIVEKLDENNIVSSRGTLTVACEVKNYLVYKEISVTATKTIPMPVDLSFVKFPTEIPITVTSTAVVQNGDEFIRNIDLAGDFISYLDEKYDLGISDFTSKISGWVSKVYEFMGI